MIDINRDNFEEVCRKLNDMEYDDAVDKEVCQWFKDKINCFGEEAEALEDLGYTYDEVCFEYWGAWHSERNIEDIVDVEIKDNKVWVNYTTKWWDGRALNHQARLPLDWIFDHTNFIAKWKNEISKAHIKTLINEINEHERKLDELKQELIVEKNKITLVS